MNILANNNFLADENSLVKIRPIPNIPESDYINANYVEVSKNFLVVNMFSVLNDTLAFQGLHSEHEYIACQAPLRNTLDDFYRCILEKKVAVIVNLLEKGWQHFAVNLKIIIYGNYLYF